MIDIAEYDILMKELSKKSRLVCMKLKERDPSGRRRAFHHVRDVARKANV